MREEFLEDKLEFDEDVLRLLLLLETSLLDVELELITLDIWLLIAEETASPPLLLEDAAILLLAGAGADDDP